MNRETIIRHVLPSFADASSSGSRMFELGQIPSGVGQVRFGANPFLSSPPPILARLRDYKQKIRVGQR